VFDYKSSFHARLNSIQDVTEQLKIELGFKILSKRADGENHHHVYIPSQQPV
jgi:hypothetical protein